MSEEEWEGEERRQHAVLSKDQFHQIKRLAYVAIVLFLIGLAYSTWLAYSGREDQRSSQVAGCKRGKKDRTTIARGLRASAKFKRAYGRYNKVVTNAPNSSVKKDVRDAAAVLRKTVKFAAGELESTSRELRSRTGKHLDCDAIPRATLTP